MTTPAHRLRFPPRPLRGLFLAAMLGGCLSGGGGPFTRSSAGAAELRVLAENLSTYDVRIYAQTAGSLRLLGIVGGNTNHSFRIPWSRPGDVRFRVEEVAGRTYTTNRLAVIPGDRLDLILPVNLGNAFVRRR